MKQQQQEIVAAEKSIKYSLDAAGWKNFTLELNPYTWTKAANVIFLDLPAGVGFSYATTLKGWTSSDSILAIHSYEFLMKWFVEHPKFLKNSLYISGISYMGILVPPVTLQVYKGNENGRHPQLNIKGYLIVSPLTDRFTDLNSRLEFAHRIALISDDIYEAATKITLDAWANEKEVQEALHVREGTIGVWEKTNETIHYTFGKNDTICYSYDVYSTVNDHKQLVTRNCQALIISGDHDMTFPYVGTGKWIKSLNVPIERSWNPWFVNNQVAGYQMTYATTRYSLVYATIKGAGHSVSLNKPEEASVLLDEWLASRTYLAL
ncbi:hypothetical protein SSX86_015999 [Deinandra increscens subsp. villosa]|uniref:Serine carboxypeptidase n=1 Tax=Deinandra increscens subsp. villosa TaxID=3103831 RepID=A0AAP0GXZ8_9ASTR